jgi:hypothetical protein
MLWLLCVFDWLKVSNNVLTVTAMNCENLQELVYLFGLEILILWKS